MSPGVMEAEPARVGVAVPAAGSGRRMGGVRKAFLELAGEPLLVHALRPFLADGRVVRVAVALSPEDMTDPPDWLVQLDERITVVPGGVTRGVSVANCLAELPADVDVIAVHDAARPLVPPDVVRRCLDVAASGIGAVAGCPAVDTMKFVEPGAFIRSTPDRSTLWHAHTPQAFPAAALRLAYDRGDMAATDDASLVELQGLRIRMIDDGDLNPKITRPGDVPLGEAMIEVRRRRGGPVSEPSASEESS